MLGGLWSWCIRFDDWFGKETLYFVVWTRVLWAFEYGRCWGVVGWSFGMYDFGVIFEGLWVLGAPNSGFLIM